MYYLFNENVIFVYVIYISFTDVIFKRLYFVYIYIYIYIYLNLSYFCFKYFVI